MTNIEFIEDAYSDFTVYQAVEEAKAHCSERVCSIIDLLRSIRISLNEHGVVSDIPMQDIDNTLLDCGYPKFLINSIRKALLPLSEQIAVISVDLLQDMELDLITQELLQVSKKQ